MPLHFNVNLKDGKVFDGHLRRYRAVVDLDGQSTGSYELFRIPPGKVFLHGQVVTDTSLSTATIAIGTAGSTAKYKAAGTLTAVDTPTLFGKAAEIAGDGIGPSTIGNITKGGGSDEDIVLTVAGASLPSSGTLAIDMIFSGT